MQPRNKMGDAPHPPFVTMKTIAPHVALFTLDRPRQRNAVNEELSNLMESLLDAFEADEGMWVGIVCSSTPDKVFSAGADLKAVSLGQSLDSVKGGFGGIALYPRTKPLIAAVDGPALAGGCEIALACDLIVASTAARFGVPEVKRSLIPAAGGMFRLPQRIPKAVAMEMILTGDPISSERAHAVGLVNALTPPGRALEGALALAQRIVINAPLAVMEARAVTLAALGDTPPVTTKLMRASEKGLQKLFLTDDFLEGPLAFLEKRAPKWSGKKPEEEDGDEDEDECEDEDEACECTCKCRAKL